jgi:hypothetical protein
MEPRSFVKAVSDRVLGAVGGISVLGLDGDLPLAAHPGDGEDGGAPMRIYPKEAVGTVGIWGLYMGSAGWLLAVAAVAMCAMDEPTAALTLETAAKAATAMVFGIYATALAFRTTKPLARAVMLFCAHCFLLALGDAARTLSPWSMVGHVARGASFFACSEAICATASSLNTVPESDVMTHIRHSAIGITAVRAISLAISDDAASPLHAVLGIAEAAWLGVLCWSQWKRGRVGRSPELWVCTAGGFFLVALGRVLEVASSVGLGTLAARLIGLLYAAGTYARFCATGLHGDGVFTISIGTVGL